MLKKIIMLNLVLGVSSVYAQQAPAPATTVPINGISPPTTAIDPVAFPPPIALNPDGTVKKHQPTGSDFSNGQSNSGASFYACNAIVYHPDAFTTDQPIYCIDPKGRIAKVENVKQIKVLIAKKTNPDDIAVIPRALTAAEFKKAAFPRVVDTKGSVTILPPEKAVDGISLPGCNDVRLPVGKFCIDPDNKIAKVTVDKDVNDKKAPGGFRTKFKIHELDKDELASYEKKAAIAKKAIGNYREVADFCDNLDDKIADRADNIDDMSKHVDDIQQALLDLKLDERDARKNMTNKCHNQCIAAALSPTAPTMKGGVSSSVKNPCSIDPTVLAEVLGPDDVNNSDVMRVFGTQNDLIAQMLNNKESDRGEVCQTMMGRQSSNPLTKGSACSELVMNNGGIDGCSASYDWVDANTALINNEQELVTLKAEMKAFADHEKDNTDSCVITDKKSVQDPKWNYCSNDCLVKAKLSCPQAKKNAEKSADKANRSIAGDDFGASHADSICATCRSTGPVKINQAGTVDTSGEVAK